MTRETFEDYGLPMGQCYGSKRVYASKYPEDLIVFNARVFVDDKEVWNGDLHFKKEMDKLKKVAKDIGNLLIMREDGEKVMDIKNER